MDTSSGRAMCGKETIACPGARPGRRSHRPASMPLTVRRNVLTTSASVILCKMYEFTRPKTCRGRCCGNCVTNMRPSQRLPTALGNPCDLLKQDLGLFNPFGAQKLVRFLNDHD